MNINDLANQFNSININEYSGRNGATTWMDAEAIEDCEYISGRKEIVIAGFLNIGKNQGWNREEGDHFETG
jgi:hypothetical protein